MNNLKTTVAIVILVCATTAGADDGGHKYKKSKHEQGARQDLYEYARVIEARPIYRQVRVSHPVRECAEVPIYHTETRQPKSAGGILAGGIIGGIIGHQFGKGRGNKAATAVGTLIGAQIGHEAVNGHRQQGHGQTEVVGYEEHCTTRHQVGYEEVLDGYDVTYQYRGRRYNIEMPYHPGKQIKMRIQFTPVI